jgi:predicted aspartyl protease
VNHTKLEALSIVIRRFSTVWLFIVLLGAAALSAGCGASENSLARVTQGAPGAALTAETPRAKAEATNFSKNFFSAFPLVQIKINDSEPLSFLFDTGNAGLSVVDATVAHRLGLELAPSGSISFAGVTLPTLRAKAERFQIINNGRVERRLALREISFDVVDLAPFAELAGRRVDGILGYDVIHRFVTTVDYGRQTVIFGRQTETLPTPQRTPAPEPRLEVKGDRMIMPFALRDGWIVVKTRINGSDDEEMILDTGASLTTFSRERARRLNLDVSRARPTTLILPIGRLTYLPHRLREIEFGGVMLKDAATVVVSTREGLFTSGTNTSLLGANILRHFRLTIDYGRRQLTLQRNADFEGDPHEYVSVGVLPKLRDGRFYVSGVINGSPADEEGIEIGDQITRLDGRTMDQFSFGELVDALRGAEGSEVEITVQRGQRTIPLKLKRVKLL